jgi:AcrR family transcriptional regulator
LETAVKLFLELGYHNLRIEDITSSAGLGKGTFYLHFAGKRDLLLAYFEDVLERVAAVEAKADDDGLDHFSRVLLRMNSALDPEGNWHKVFTFLRISANSSDPEISTAAREVHRRMAEPAQREMARAIKRGEVHDVNTELATFAWVGMQEALAWRLSLDTRYQTSEIATFAIDAYRRMFMERAHDQLVAEAERMTQLALASPPVAPYRSAQSGDAALDTRQKLVEAAIDLFLVEGYGNLRISDITDYAGVGKGTFYLHFAGKRELLLAYFERHQEMIAAVEAEVSASGLDHVAKVAKRMSSALDPAGRSNKVMTFLRISANSGDAEIATAASDLHRRMLEPAKKDLTLAMKAGVLRELDEELAAIAWGGMQEVLAWRAEQDDRYDKATITAFLADLYTRAFMRAPAGRPEPANGDGDTPTSKG